jgi:hypothetical protein
MAEARRELPGTGYEPITQRSDGTPITFRSTPRKVPFADLSEESVRCRVDHHDWQKYDARKISGGFEEEKQCSRCKSRLFLTYSNEGEVIGRRVRYAEFYLSAEGRITKAERNQMRRIVLGWDYGL